MRGDRRAVVLGTLGCAALVGGVGYGSLWLLVRLTPAEAGVPIGGAAGAWVLVVLLVASSSAYTARRARAKDRDGFREGACAGAIGYLVASVVAFGSFLSFRGADFSFEEEWVNLATLIASGLVAALVGARWEARRDRGTPS